MEQTEVIQSLETLFNQPLNDYENRRIVFWLDQDNEFTDFIDGIDVENVKVHQLTKNNQFYTQYLLEQEDRHHNYLIYTTEEMDVEDNWLMDTYLYSKVFHADKISLIMREHGIDSSLRSIVKKYKKFFANQERVRRLKTLAINRFDEETLEIGLMSALCGLKMVQFEEVMKAVLMDTLEDNENQYVTQFHKFIDENVFWKYAAKYYGFEQNNPTLKKLMTHLMVTALSHSLDDEHLRNIETYLAKHNRSNSFVFIDRWMHHSEDVEIYDQYANSIQNDIQIADIVRHLTIDEIKKVDVFPYLDEAIIQYIYTGLEANHEDYEAYKSIIRIRRAKHFYTKYQYEYECLFLAADMFAFKKEYPMGISKEAMKDMHAKYVNQYYKLDTLYRKFYVAFDQAESNDRLSGLQDLIENLYSNWFMTELNTQWTTSVQEEITDEWKIDGVLNQQEFYMKYIDSHVFRGERVFVIISDALRYDVGVEVADRLEQETRGSSDVTSMLSVIPSVTKLGMAALLPHRDIELDDKTNVSVAGQSTKGTENREKILQKRAENALAVSYHDVKAMNKSGRREYFKGSKLNYIYHNTIDATGDNASTEKFTINAVEQAINEIYDIVKMISDELSGTNIYITSDHGFIYQRKPLEESDKLEQNDLSAVERKRRYLLSNERQQIDGLLRVPLKNIVADDDKWNVYVPKSTIRFKMKGQGVNFVHGGASMQEVVVPLITFRNARRGQAHSKETEQVDVKLTNTSRKITNSLFKLSFFQSEKIEGKVIPRTVRIYMVDDEENVISNEEVVIADKQTERPEDRMFNLQFALKTQEYDRNKTYELIIKDMESEIILDRIGFAINLGITNEFDF
ncbi:BREX-1 system phosphatase PglZ type A [Salibacterium aidingense]|uniref:BREX-1 system phosphatase PglZ type A n=1 Tax=Salibacterium aidingense TaxID=384933 RepID=UPI0003FD0129|nr:BREX-1 system phosphatase PglZ type A [Salibacterium aidingense]